LTLRISYGEGYVEACKVDPSRVEWLLPKRLEAPLGVEQAYAQAMASPLGVAKLSEERFESAAVIIPDHTRPPSPFLRPLLEELSRRARDVAVFVAGGTHQPPRCSQLRKLVSEELFEEHWFRFRHSCAKSSSFKLLGYTSRGTPVEVNRELLNYDLVVSTLCVRPHYFAGWEGGAKAILPGCSSLRSIARNHSYAVGNPKARELIIDGNPVREDMNEAASIVSREVKLRALDFVVDVEGRLGYTLYGDPLIEHREAAKLSLKLYMVESKPADMVITVAEGGLGRNLFQSLKAYHHASNIAKRDGKTKVVLVASMEEGVGNEVFAKEYARYAGMEPDEVVKDIKERIEAGEFNEVFQKIARMAEDSRYTKLVVVAPKAPSDLEKFLSKVDIEYAKDLDDVIGGVEGRIVVVPYGAAVVPVSSTNTLSRSV